MRSGQGQLVFVFDVSADPEPMISTIGFNASLTGPGDLQGWADIARDAFQDFLLPLMSVVTDLTEVRAQKHVGTGIAEAVSVSGVNGNVSGQIHPPNTAYLIQKHTTDFGRGKSGRMFLPGVVAADTNDIGQIDGGVVTGWNAGLSDFFDTFPSEFLVVNHASGSSLGLTSPIDTLTIAPVVATQRRRLRPQ